LGLWMGSCFGRKELGFAAAVVGFDRVAKTLVAAAGAVRRVASAGVGGVGAADDGRPVVVAHRRSRSAAADVAVAHPVAHHSQGSRS